jgi:hypothetical protein
MTLATRHLLAMALIGDVLAVEQCGNTTTGCLSAAQCCKQQWSPTTFGCSVPATGGLPGTCCKPGVQFAGSTTVPNCLIIGDSVSIGYTGVVKKALDGVCAVQHGPWDEHDGGAETTAYGLSCLSEWLVTQAQAHVKWDVIQFNFGLHDLSPATADQEVYRQQLGRIADKLLRTGAKLQYALTTPFMPQSANGTMVVERLNALATREMWNRSIPIVDLYTTVTAHCGAVYEHCDWCKIDPCSYHYNNAGYTQLGNAVAAAFKARLSQ